MQYSEKVLDHFTHPRNVGEIEDANGVGEVGNAKCGDIMKIYLKVSDDGIIEDVKFKTFGCGAAIATSSMATEMVKGKSLEEALKLTNKAVAEALDGLVFYMFEPERLMRPLDPYLGSACKIALLNEHFDKFRLIKLGRNDNILSLLDIRADSDDKLGVAFEFFDIHI